MIDLWPEVIKYTDMKAPVNILKEQAALLGNKTQNIVTAKVSPFDTPGESPFVYSFLIVATALGNYHYELFKIEYDIEFYPARIYLDTEIADELSKQGLTIDEVRSSLIGRERLIAYSESEFLELLRKIFSAKKTQRIISALLTQSTTS